MDQARQSEAGSILVTGVSGNLGARLLLQLTGSRVVGVDLHPPSSSTGHSSRFESIDISDEDSCDQLVRLDQAWGDKPAPELAHGRYGGG